MRFALLLAALPTVLLYWSTTFLRATSAGPPGQARMVISARAAVVPMIEIKAAAAAAMIFVPSICPLCPGCRRYGCRPDDCLRLGLQGDEAASGRSHDANPIAQLWNCVCCNRMLTSSLKRSSA